MNLRIDLNEPRIEQKITNNKFGLLVANEWKRLIDSYTPRDIGAMQETAKLKPWQIHYIQNYSEAVYYMRSAKFQKKNPYSTYEWDKAAEKAGQKDKLCRTLNNALQSGRF